MSRCHETYRRCASVALVLALVLIALPSFAQTSSKASSASSDDAVPKVEVFVGYQWWNPGGNLPDQNSPPNAVKIPSSETGFGANLSYNFTKYWALEGNYGGNWGNSPPLANNALALGAEVTWRTQGVDFFAPTPPRFHRFSARGIDAPHRIPAGLGG